MRIPTGRGWYRCLTIWFPFEPSSPDDKTKRISRVEDFNKAPTLHPSPLKMLSSLERRRKEVDGAQWRGSLSERFNPDPFPDLGNLRCQIWGISRQQNNNQVSHPVSFLSGFSTKFKTENPLWDHSPPVPFPSDFPQNLKLNSPCLTLPYSQAPTVPSVAKHFSFHWNLPELRFSIKSLLRRHSQSQQSRFS